MDLNIKKKLSGLMSKWGIVRDDINNFINIISDIVNSNSSSNSLFDIFTSDAMNEYNNYKYNPTYDKGKYYNTMYIVSNLLSEIINFDKTIINRLIDTIEFTTDNKIIINNSLHITSASMDGYVRNLIDKKIKLNGYIGASSSNSEPSLHISLNGTYANNYFIPLVKNIIHFCNDLHVITNNNNNNWNTIYSLYLLDCVFDFRNGEAGYYRTYNSDFDLLKRYINGTNIGDSSRPRTDVVYHFLLGLKKVLTNNETDQITSTQQELFDILKTKLNIDNQPSTTTISKQQIKTIKDRIATATTVDDIKSILNDTFDKLIEANIFENA